MALDLAHDDTHNKYRNVQHSTPQHFATASDAKHPAPILNTNVNPVSEIFSYTGDRKQFILVMVGLPARGKSFIARKLRSYLSWLGFDVQWFNIGQYRRYCAKDTVGVQSADWFAPSNELTKKRRELYALIALTELEKFLLKGDGGQKVAILDGTNSTDYRRRMIRQFFERKDSRLGKVKLLFVESICNDESIIERNILNVKLRSPDYVNVTPEKAVIDFKQRIKHYETTYCPVTDEDGSYIKIIDAGKKVIGHQVNGYLPSRILYFLMHINLNKVSHFFTRHGESQYNVQARIGGDSPLSAQGQKYSKTMADFMSLQPEFKSGDMKVWCSTLKRCVQTAEAFQSLQTPAKVYKWRALCEIEAGLCDSMTYEQIEVQYPEEFQLRRGNKLTYRYPQGESYKDVIKRLEPVIFELERATRPVLVIAHQAVLRCLYGYFMDKPLEEVPYIKIDLHTVYKLSPTDYSTEVDKFTFGCGHTLLSKRDSTSAVHKAPQDQLMSVADSVKEKDIGSLSAQFLPRMISPQLLEEQQKDRLNQYHHRRRHSSPVKQYQRHLHVHRRHEHQEKDSHAHTRNDNEKNSPNVNSIFNSNGFDK